MSAPIEHTARSRRPFASSSRPPQQPLTFRDAAANTFEGVLGSQLRTPTSANPLRQLQPLSRGEAEQQAELHAALPNPADLIKPDTKLRDEWLWLAQKANTMLGPQSLVPPPGEKIDDDALAHEVVERMHAM